MQPIHLEDDVCKKIRGKLNCLPLSYECCIFRVHNILRQVNENAYEPDIIAIGPYHHGKENLKMMEEHKLRYLKHHIGEDTEKLNRYVLALRALEEEAYRCYAEPLTLDKEKWVEMMILDGCFIIELVQKFGDRHLREDNDHIFEMDWIVNTLQRDLLLFENQLPFFVLCRLFDLIEGPNNHPLFVSRVLKFFGDILPGKGREKNIRGDLHTLYKHLLRVVYNNWLPSFSEERYGRDVKFIQCVMDLREAGIKFERGNENNLFNIKFKEGVIQIPLLKIEDRTESFLRNLIAYEQLCEDRRLHFVSDYAIFLDCLINSPNDVRVLCRKGIIDNCLGDDEEVSSMFKKLTKSVVQSGPLFVYDGIFEKINVHYGKRKNRWMAKLRRNYLNSPWAIISSLAAISLLVLTFLQTLYTIKSAYV
ncbi:hypothetical protein LguiA_029153 [Lonicera macranthoides]